MTQNTIDFLSALGSVLSAIVAIVAFAYSYFQSNFKKYEVKRDYRNAIFTWFAATTRLLLELRFLLMNNPEEFDKRKPVLMADLSAHIEMGRLYFPNIDKGDGYGADKPRAFRGYRNLTLDFVVYSSTSFCERTLAASSSI